MATFADLADIFDPTLRLTIAGTEYVIPPPNAKTGLRFQALQAVTLAVANGQEVPDTVRRDLLLDDEEEIDFLRDALGPVYDQLLDAGVPWPWVKHAGTTAFIYWTQGETAAADFWANAGKAPAPVPPSTRSGRTGAAENTTKRPASGSGTTTRPKSSTASKPAPKKD